MIRRIRNFHEVDNGLYPFAKSCVETDGRGDVDHFFSFRRLVCGYPLVNRQARRILVLQAYLDETSGNSEYIVAGYLASVSQWDEFSQRWLEVCEASPSIRYLHMHEAEGCKGEFLGWDTSARDAKIDALASVIPFHVVCEVQCKLKHSFYNTIVKGKVPKKVDNPYFLCAQTVVILVSKYLDFEGSQHKVNVVFDKQGKVGTLFKRHFDKVLKANFSRLGELFHLDDKETPPLQAADMIAAHIRRRADPIPVEPQRQSYYILSNVLRKSVELDSSALFQIMQKAPQSSKRDR